MVCISLFSLCFYSMRNCLQEQERFALTFHFLECGLNLLFDGIVIASDKYQIASSVLTFFRFPPYNLTIYHFPVFFDSRGCFSPSLLSLVRRDIWQERQNLRQKRFNFIEIAWYTCG